MKLSSSTKKDPGVSCKKELKISVYPDMVFIERINFVSRKPLGARSFLSWDGRVWYYKNYSEYKEFVDFI